MRILLVGCGGIGGVVAASLSRAGVELDIVTGNTTIRDAIAQRGLRVRDLDQQEWSVAPLRQPVVQLGELRGTYDLCLLSTKTTTLDTALSEVRPLLSPAGDVVLLQNGLPEERAEAIVGRERVIGCVVGWGATIIEPGMSARTSRGGLQLGRRQSKGTDQTLSDQTLTRAAELLGRAFEVRLVDDLEGVRWSKLAINCATSTLGAAGGDMLGPLLRQRFVRRLALEIWAELCAVARAQNVRMAKVMGTLDIERLAISESERLQRVGSPGLFLKHSLLLGIGLKFRRMRSSMAVAIERGRKPEIDYLNGEVVRRGELLGIPTPVNRALVKLIHEIVAGNARPGVNTLYDVYLRHCTPQGRPNSPTMPPPQKSAGGLRVDSRG